MEKNNKLTILSLIHENKDVLFGRFSDKLTHEVKVNKWKDIAEQLTSLGIYSKDWRYLRDTTWQNFRKRTIEKRDNRQQTGSGGGKKCRYDDVDELVLKIIGKDSPVIDGLCVPESSGSNQVKVHEPESSETIIQITSVENTPTQVPRTQRKRNQSISINEADVPPEYIDLKARKIEIELKIADEKLEIAKRERYKLDLEILKLEKELNIQQPSSFTLQFYLQNVVIAESSSSQTLSNTCEPNHETDILDLQINNSVQ